MDGGLLVALSCLLIIITYAWMKFVKTGPVFKNDLEIDGKTVLITGGSYGIGKETALQLAKRKARVIIASRNEQRASEAIFDIKSQSGNDMVHYMKLDLSDFADVRRFVRNFIDTEPRLDILINNAGVAVPGMTNDGNDIILATNQLGPFLLTNLLIPLLKSSSDSQHVRIVNVSADLYTIGKIDFGNINLGLTKESPYQQIIQQYSNTKLMNVYFTTELNKRLRSEDPENSSISTYALHPGVIASELGTGAIHNTLMKVGHLILKACFMRPLFYGCQTILYCCLQKGLKEKSGGYFSNMRMRQLKAVATDSETGLKLWKVCEQMTGLTKEEDYFAKSD
ncbi:dehydrogenase/reductase SDR family member 13-like [Styela clava]